MSEVKRYSRNGKGMHASNVGAFVMVGDFDAEHALRLEAERQVGELREQLKIIDSFWRPECDRTRVQLDTAMGFIRRLRESSLVSDRLSPEIDDFLNTTSTEGKDSPEDNHE